MLSPDSRQPLSKLVVGVALAFSTAYAMACGGGFPNRLLEDRDATMSTLPQAYFASEVRRLALDIPGLPPKETERYSPNKHDRSMAEYADAPTATESTLYQLGAAAFARGEQSMAQDYFRQVLALPTDEQAARGLWAAYSLGRSLWLEIDQSADTPDTHSLRMEKAEQARQAFQQVRQRAAEGASDRLGLALSSLGEEARVELAVGNWSRAIALYASQYNSGDYGGFDSLQLVTTQLQELPIEELTPLLAQAAVHQLLIAYEISNPDAPSYHTSKLRVWLKSSTIQSLEGLDRLAAFSYQSGDYQQAATLLEHAPNTGLSWWLRAKLALRAGDKRAAQAAYANAVQAFPNDESWGPADDDEPLKAHCRAEAEGAILALQRGDYLDALDGLFHNDSQYWPDTADVAERVLTTDELKGYVDSRVPARSLAVEHHDNNGAAMDSGRNTSLRALLARRLMRDGRYQEAVAYFTHDEQDAASAYGQAKAAIASSWTDTGRAEALYQLAKLTREHGMELFGFELYRYLGHEWRPNRKRPLLQESALLSRDEIRRRTENTIPTSERYQFYKNAADLARQAADLLPTTSQAYAATLCKAAGWTLDNHKPLAVGYYRRYVSDGPAVPWAADFGRHCQQPDFSRVDSDLWQARWDNLRRTVRPYKVGIAALTLLGGAGLIAVWRQRRGRMAAPAHAPS